MTKEEKLAALKFVKKVINAQIEKLKKGGDVETFDEPCEPGKIRNAQGECVDKLG